ncbi:pilus assembly protein TadG-related protein, partial [Cypionkella sp.]|uniref:pilus assembly protein TadG-related protein n=1 Tax=Cypionkella sp. TaxID=2811411 RepID=UPI002ABCA2EE
MQIMIRAKAFRRQTNGSISAFFAIIFPVLLLIGGLATDVTLLNAQKRYVQSQADLAAQSAARYLPDVTKTRSVARAVVSANAGYGNITIADTDILFGSYTNAGGFIAAANQNNPTGATAVKVTVPSPFQPLLLAPILSDENMTIRRSAVGQQQSVIVFTLRNRLLSVNTRRSTLDAVLGPLGLGLTANALSYEGLANTRVKVDDLLGLATIGLATDTLTFDDVLNLPVTMPSLLGGLVGLGGLPPSAVPGSGVASDTVTLGEILAMSPTLLDLKVGDVLPDVSLNAFDLLMAFAGLASGPTERLSVTTGLDLSPLASVALQLGLIRPPVTAMGVIGDAVPVSAHVAQVEASLSANIVSGLARVNLDLALGDARATALSVNCMAINPSDTLAVFEVATAPATIGLDLQLLQLVNGKVKTADGNPIAVAGATYPAFAIRLDQFRQPVPVNNPISLTTVRNSLSSVLTSLKEST